ncbi:MAG: ParB N-terminal domain-containing protein [Pseudomonadota bacterium]
MARRKRLSPAAALTDAPAPEVKSAAHPPIASLVADAAGRDALMEAAGEHRAAREEGRLVVDLPLEAVAPGFLVRDRMAADDDDMATLTASIEDRGQQTPIEVQDLGDGAYGLISGWRRLEALKALALRHPGRFGTVKAFVRTVESQADAYVAMVEENEVRANLSYYERARIAHEAAEKGVFPTAEIAVRELFRHASRPKRSKILSFLRVHRALGGVLRFPTAIGERAGLTLARALEDEGAANRIAERLADSGCETAEDELSTALEAARSAPGPLPAPSSPAPSAAKPALTERTAPQGVRLRVGDRRVELSGAAVDTAFVADLQKWLAERLTP